MRLVIALSVAGVLAVFLLYVSIAGGRTPQLKPSHGSVPDLFKVGRHIVVDGRYRNGVFVAKRDTLVTKCPSKYTPKRT